MMRLSEAVGIEIPSIKLIAINEIKELPFLKKDMGNFVYAISRFDRTADDDRIHCEDFAQVLNIRPSEKYEATNYDTLARIIKANFKDGLIDVKQFILRIFVNILLGNTDAHLKNWTVIYKDGRTPQLAPAYDIVSTLEYIPNTELALNFAKVKDFYAINNKVLSSFANRIEVEEKWIREIVEEIVDSAYAKWPLLLKELPIQETTLQALKLHWKKLQKPFRII